MVARMGVRFTCQSSLYVTYDSEWNNTGNRIFYSGSTYANYLLPWKYGSISMPTWDHDRGALIYFVLYFL